MAKHIILIITLILLIQTWDVEQLVVRNGEELVLLGSELSITIILSIVLLRSTGHIAVLVVCHRCTLHHISIVVEEAVGSVLCLVKVCIQSLRSDAPTAKVEEAAILHGHFQTTLPLQALTCMFLSVEIVFNRIFCDLALVGSIFNMLAYRVGSTTSDGIDNIAGLRQTAALDKACQEPLKVSPLERCGTSFREV